ncbi:hypothetical protein IJE86_08220 [bacterium]|nr:hypothetical protein [bacterium]
MITVDLSLKGLANGNFFNFLVIAIAIGFIFKHKLLSMMEAAKVSVVNLIEKSDLDKLESENILSEAKKEVENLPQELEKIKEDSQRTVESYRKAAEDDIHQTSLRLESNAQKIIDNEVQKVASQLQKNLALSAIDAAHKKTVENLANNDSLHRQLIAESINMLEGLEIK